MSKSHSEVLFLIPPVLFDRFSILVRFKKHFHFAAKSCKNKLSLIKKCRNMFKYSLIVIFGKKWCWMMGYVRYFQPETVLFSPKLLSWAAYLLYNGHKNWTLEELERATENIFAAFFFFSLPGQKMYEKRNPFSSHAQCIAVVLYLLHLRPLDWAKSSQLRASLSLWSRWGATSKDSCRSQ